MCTAVNDRFVASNQPGRSERKPCSDGLWTHANNAVPADVVRRWVVSGTDVHRSVWIPYQTRLCHVQWNLRRATTSQQSAAAGLDFSQAQTGSASHCLRLQELFTGVSSEDNGNWSSGCHQQHCRAFRTVSTGALVSVNILIVNISTNWFLFNRVTTHVFHLWPLLLVHWLGPLWQSLIALFGMLHLVYGMTSSLYYTITS